LHEVLLKCLDGGIPFPLIPGREEKMQGLGFGAGKEELVD
jgi:hypothetical protein